MRQIGLRTALAVGLLALAGTALADQRLTFSVPYAGNLDMSPARLASLLASPDVQVQISYEPAVGIPLWTSHLGYCTGKRICFKKSWETLALKPEKIERGPDHLSFMIPDHHWFGLIRYHVAGPVRIVLPALWPGEQAGNIDIDVHDAEGPAHPVVLNMHLPVPYVGVGVFRLDPHDGPIEQPAAVAAPCDAVLTVNAGQPGVKPHVAAQAYLDWLRKMGDSQWWSDQIPDAQFSRMNVVPPAMLAQKPTGVDTRRISVDRGDVHLLYVRTRYTLADTRGCKRTHQRDFAWLNGELLASSHSESPDIFSADDCDSSGLSEEALWSQGQLVSYFGPVAGKGNTNDTSQWLAWKQERPECRVPGEMTDRPDTQGLVESAAIWRDFLKGLGLMGQGL